MDLESTSRLREKFGDAILESHDFRGDETVAVPADRIVDVLSFLKEDPALDYDFLSDLCAVHYPEREYQYEVVYHLHSYSRNHRLRVKARIFEGHSCPTVVPLFEGANWLEREAWDMVGVVFEGHPDLRRILMPDDYVGHPLRRDFPLTG